MFSSRTGWQRRHNRLSEAHASRQARELGIYDLTASNPTECGFDYPQQDILKAISHPSLLQYTPDPHGLLSARDAISRWYRKHGVSIETSSLFLTSGTSEAYSFIFRLLCNTGDSLLVPAPSYPLLDYLAPLNDVTLDHYYLIYDDGWHIDVAALRSSITPSTRAIVLVHPHNPTGMFINHDEFSSIAAIARDHNLAIIVDEVFAEYGFQHHPNRLRTAAGNNDCLTFTLNGISKMCGLPQLKLGWMVVSGQDVGTKEAIERLEIISDAYLSVNTPVQAGLPGLLEVGDQFRQQIQRRIIDNVEYLRTAIGTGSACSLLVSEGGWNAIIRVPNSKSDEDWALEILEEAGVYVYPGYFFDFANEGHLVLSLICDTTIFRRAVPLLINYIDDHS